MHLTEGLAEDWQLTAGFMTHVTCRLTAKNRDQLRNPTLGNQVWATFTFLKTRDRSHIRCGACCCAALVKRRKHFHQCERPMALISNLNL